VPQEKKYGKLCLTSYLIKLHKIRLHLFQMYNLHLQGGQKPVFKAANQSEKSTLKL